MCTYLHHRGPVYYFRRAIPVELRPELGGRSEFMVSLRTKDRETAKRLIPTKTLWSDELLDAARNRIAENRPERGAVARSSAPGRAESALFAQGLEAAEIAYRDMDRREERLGSNLRKRMDAAVRKSTAEMTPEEQVVHDMLRDLREEMTMKQERDALRVVRRAEERRGVAPPATAPASSPSNGVMLDGALIDLWAAERKVVRKGVDTHRAVARWFYERVGRKPVTQISRADVLAFKAKLIEEGQSAANIKMKLSRLRTLLQWAADNDHSKDNAAAGVSIKDTEAAKNKRREFDLPALKAIFASPIYAEAARPVQGRGEASYWLPLLALFTGARLEELGQLRPGDVRAVTYPDANGADQSGWIIRIQEDQADNLRLKNAASERDVPVHPELIRLGFVEFSEAARDAKQDRLFPALRPNVYGRLTAKWGEWFGAYLRKVCDVADKRMVFHSFRHTFKQYARLAGIEEGVQRQIMGHSSGDVADQYGSGYPLHQVFEGMRRYTVPGLKIG